MDEDDDADILGADIESQIQANKVLLGVSNCPVYKVKFKGEDVAVKKILHPSKPPRLNPSDPNYIRPQREWEIQLNLDHKNVLGLRAVGVVEDFKYLVMDLCAGSLDQVFSPGYNGPSLPSPDLKVLYQIASGVAYLHEQMNLIHRDIKPQNILLSKDDPVLLKVADFGCSKSTTPGTGTCSWSDEFGTKDYRSPEYAAYLDDVVEARKKNEPPPERGRISNKSDVFSTGLVFFYVLSRGYHPFGENALLETSNIASGKTVNFDERLWGVSKDLKQLLRRMIDVSSDSRPKMIEVKKELEKKQ